MSVNQRHQRGMGLVELMVSLVIGMIVISGALTLASSTMGANSGQMKASRLNNELRIILTNLTRDLRRAGYNNWTPAAMAAGIFNVNPQVAPSVVTTSGSESVQTTYDLNGDGATAASTETFSYRISGGAIQTQMGSSGWYSITDNSIIEITAMTITDISPPQIAPTGSSSWVTIPTYAIVLQGRLKKDPSVTRTIRETVQVRNPVVVVAS